MGIKDLAKLGFERDKERDRCATQLVARPATPQPSVRQAATAVRQPEATVRQPVTGAVIWDAADWRAYYDERAAIREYDGQRPRPFAETLAWGELQNEWHRLHGDHPPAWQCAGCQKPIGGPPVFVFPDGARAHDDLGCIAAYGRRWRSAATAALVKLGLSRPATVPEDT